MTDSADLQQVCTDSGVKVLDPALWRAWPAEGAARELRAAAKRLVAVKCLSIVVLTATALLWRYTSGYDLWIRFGVSLGALVVFFQALQLRRYAVSAAFAVLIVIYNPFVPAFPFTGAGAFTFVFLTTLPFAASLIWLRPGRSTGAKTLATLADA